MRGTVLSDRSSYQIAAFLEHEMYAFITSGKLPSVQPFFLHIHTEGQMEYLSMQLWICAK